ncbi:pectate lyase [Sphingomonas turrisvirgatae]|uniref:Pectate lyase n=1 Tax=Sphingomonas turrisvirgatae TaxID=1888892 RepID=A0A1E3LU28_9SPHN|nr:pectate lyase [Sphingomonas turrisvirgatae]ODP37258.1 pectate lyase [Sphingomonas turrisvirgatae]
MISRRSLLAASATLALMPGATLAQTRGAPVGKARILETMKRATRFMVEKIAYRGGYLWSYLPDRSRVWGELEAYKSMIWIQPPGTATMGHLYLDAYHATGDDYYYQAAASAAQGLIDGQLPTGGWGYFVDFGGAKSVRRWFDTIGKNAWRLEEFQHYYGNATFDDQGTGEAIRLLTRIYVEKREQRFKAGLDKAIDFIFASQLDNGGWPQRWPAVKDGGLHGNPDYTGYITFNDGVIHDNIELLLTYHQAIGDPRIVPAIRRAMDIYLATQQPAPQAGWGLQHSLDLKPAGARTYEPKALVTHATAANIEQLMHFYRLTGEAKYLAPIPAALDWLESVRLPAALQVGGRQFPTFVEIGTNKPLWVHRRGSNVVNGAYYVDHDPANTIGHYNARRSIDTARLRREYERLRAMPGALAAKDSPLLKGRQALPAYTLAAVEPGSDKNTAGGKTPAELVATLNNEGWWPTQLSAMSHPYAGPGPKTVTPGDFRSTDVGDRFDTSPFNVKNGPIGISTGTYIDHMITLLNALRSGG